MREPKKILSIILTLVLSISMIQITNVSAANKIKINKTKATIYTGKTVTLKLKNNKNKVKWSSSNKKIATVSSKGKVKGKKTGKVTIIAKVGKKKYKCKVTVKNKKVNNNSISNDNNTNNNNTNNTNNSTNNNTNNSATDNRIKVYGISLDTYEKNIYSDESFTIYAQVLPQNATNKTVYWTSSNPNVATVDNGVVSAIKTGKTTIYATTQEGGYVASCQVEVEDVTVKEIKALKNAIEKYGYKVNEHKKYITGSGWNYIYYDSSLDVLIFDINRGSNTPGVPETIPNMRATVQNNSWTVIELYNSYTLSNNDKMEEKYRAEFFSNTYNGNFWGLPFNQTYKSEGFFAGDSVFYRERRGSAAYQYLVKGAKCLQETLKGYNQSFEKIGMKWMQEI